MAFCPITVDRQGNAYLGGEKILNAIDLVYERTRDNISEIHLVFVGSPDFQGLDLEDNGRPHRYYCTQRPPSPGTIPKPEKGEILEVKDFGHRYFVAGEDIMAWGYVEYSRPLTQKQASDYEFVRAK